MEGAGEAWYYCGKNIDELLKEVIYQPGKKV